MPQSDLSTDPKSAGSGRPAGIRRGCVLVLSMHRSGTSGLTRLISMMGASLPATLMRAASDNETGFWESPLVADCNDALLRALGSSWEDWRHLDADTMPAGLRAGFVQDFVGVYIKEFGAAPLTVLKDPRICRIYPLWAEVFDQLEIDPCPVLPLRNPLEVAASLRLRNGFETAHGLLLWCRHMIEAERRTRGMARAWVDFAELLAEPETSLRRVVHLLRPRWPQLQPPDLAAVSDFLNSELRHHRWTQEHVDQQLEVPRIPGEIYQALRALSNNDGDAAVFERLDRLVVEFEAVAQPAARFWLREQAVRCDLDATNRLLAERTRALDDRAATEAFIAERVNDLGDRIYTALTHEIGQMAQSQSAASLAVQGRLDDGLRGLGDRIYTALTHEIGQMAQSQSAASLAVQGHLDDGLRGLGDRIYTALTYELSTVRSGQHTLMQGLERLAETTRLEADLRDELERERARSARLADDLLAARDTLESCFSGLAARTDGDAAIGGRLDLPASLAPLAARAGVLHAGLVAENQALQAAIERLSDRLDRILADDPGGVADGD